MKRMMETAGSLCTGQEQFKLKLSSHLCFSISSPTTLQDLSHHRAANFLSEAQHKGANTNFYPERVVASIQLSSRPASTFLQNFLQQAPSLAGYFLFGLFFSSCSCWGWWRMDKDWTNKQTKKELLWNFPDQKAHTKVSFQEVLMKSRIFKPLTLYNTFNCTSSSDKK